MEKPSTVQPTKPKDGSIWFDTSDPLGIPRQYDKASGEWVTTHEYEYRAHKRFMDAEHKKARKKCR